MRNSILLSLFLVSASYRARAAAPDDLSYVPLVLNAVYDPRLETGRGLKELFSSVGVMVAGPNTDLAKTFSEKLDDPALRIYFPDAAERSRAAQRMADEVKARFLSKGYTNQNMNAAMKAATDQLVALVVPRVLQKEGVKDSSRAKIWAAKILAPFDLCMGLAVSAIEGKKCTAPLEGALMKNVGLAMTFELSRQEFGQAAAAARPIDYEACLKPERAGADSRVRSCAAAGVRKSASAFGRSRLLAVAQNKMPAPMANKLEARMMPDFDKCLSTTSDRGGFVKCGDKLIETAGAEIAAQAVLTDGRIAAYFPVPADRQRVADAGRAAFASCMSQNEKANRRDATGTLDTVSCENFVTAETERTVSGEVFRTTILKNLPDASPAARAASLKTANDRLAGCWNSHGTEKDNSTCLRAAARQTASELADNRLSAQLPPDARDPALHARLLKSFSGCFEKRLPADLFHSDAAASAASTCATDTLRAAALEVAEFKVRAALRGKLEDPAAVDKLVTKRVRGDFGSCLGTAPPTNAHLDECSLSLQKNVALDSAAALVPRKIDNFFEKSGGLDSYGITIEQRQKMIDGALSAHQECLDQEVTTADSNAELAGCFKNTVRELVLQLAKLELTKQAKANGLDVTATTFAQTTAELGASFSACLEKRRDSKFTLDEYLEGLNSCETELTKKFSSQLAKRELAGIARQVLGESAGQIESKLGKSLDDCMVKASDSDASATCVVALRSEGTIEIAKAGVQARAAKEMNGLVPAELTPVEAAFDACVAEKKKTTDECAVEYVKGSTKTLGHLVLTTQIAKEVGAKKTAKLGPEIQVKLENPFSQCVDSVNPTIDQKMLDALDVCGNRLTQNALDYMMHHKTDIAIESVLSYFRPKPIPTGPDKLFAKYGGNAVGQEELTGMMARTMLCLNDHPGSLEPLKNLQPGSTEDQLVKLIGSYVSYDVNDARGEYESVLTKVSDELKAAGPVAARRKLLSLLTEQGAVDQLIKGLLKSDLQKSLAGKGIPAGVTAKLTEKDFIDSAIPADLLSTLRAKMAMGVLDPVLVDGNSLKQPGVKRALLAVRADALEALLAAPNLGADDLVKTQIRQALSK
jgi:hypothetical protein